METETTLKDCGQQCFKMQFLSLFSDVAQKNRIIEPDYSLKLTVVFSVD